MRARARRAAVRSDAREQALDAEAEALEYRAEQLRLLVAVAAAAAEDDLVLDRLQVNVDSSLDENVQIFKSDRSQMRAVEGIKHCLRGLGYPRIADPFQVGVKVQLADGPIVVNFSHRGSR